MANTLWLYHGNSIRVEVLEPSQAHDWGNAEGSRLAVYATSSRDEALAFALVIEEAIPEGHY